MNRVFPIFRSTEPLDSFRKDADVRWQFGVPPKTAMRYSAIFKTKGTLRVMSEAKDNNANFACVQHFIRTKSSTLATLRGTLLPKLLSGDLSVAKVEQTQESDAQ